MSGCRISGRTIGRWLILIGLGAFPWQARAETITFRVMFDSAVQLPQGARIIANIKMKTPTQKAYKILSFAIPNPGHQETSQISCSQPGIFFTAELTDIFYEPAEPEIEKQCQAGEIAFVFREKAYASLLRDAFTGDGIAAAGIDTGTMALYDSLNTALKAQDFGTAMTKASQLHTVLTKSGKMTKAEPFRVLNLDLATSKLKAIGLASEEIDGLFFDPTQQKYVLGDTAVAHLKKFQQLNDLPVDGRLNWQTMKTLGNM